MDKVHFKHKFISDIHTPCKRILKFIIRIEQPNRFLTEDVEVCR